MPTAVKKKKQGEIISVLLLLNLEGHRHSFVVLLMWGILFISWPKMKSLSSQLIEPEFFPGLLCSALHFQAGLA